MTTSPKISVLMPVYNCELYIKEAIDSILNQTFSDFELLIIDDASNDKTVEVIKTITDSRIQLIVKVKNSGYTNSLNYGISIAKGEYIARMDGDDISLPERFEKQVEFLDKNPDVALCGTSFIVIGTENKVFVPEKHNDIKVGMLTECKIAHPTVMMRNDFLKKNNLIYDTTYEPAEDYDLWVRISKTGKLHNLQEPLLYYRVHKKQVSSTKNQTQKDNANNIKINLLTYLDNSISEVEKQIYKKMMFNINEVSFVDFKVFLKLKLRLFGLNENDFFDKKLFKKHFFYLEKQYITLYFFGKKQYNFQLFFTYLVTFNKISIRLTTRQTIKLFLKCLFFYKAK